MPARLENDRFRLELSIVGYEFPDEIKDVYDANWLIIRVVLSTLYGAWRWQVEDAGALTWELEECIRWLADLSQGRVVERDSFEFSEPDIRFETIPGTDSPVIGLTIYLMDEFQPPSKVLTPREHNIASLRFHTPPDVIKSFASALADELARFPPRGKRPVE